MSAFFYWSGLLFWLALTGAFLFVAFAIAREFFWGCVYVWRLIRLGGWREGLPKWKRPWRFIRMAWKEVLDRSTYMEHTLTGQRVYHPLYKGARDD